MKTIIKILSIILIIVLTFLYGIGDKTEEQKQANLPINVSATYSRFDTIMHYTFLWEGGYQNYPTDKGNYSTDSVLCGTKYGISAIAYEDYYKAVTPEKMQNLSIETAKNIYLRKYYLPMQITKINNNAVAHLLFDTYIASPSTCKRILSNMLQQNIKIPLHDSIIEKVNSYDSNSFFTEFWNQRSSYIQKRAVLYPEFEKGWHNRLLKIKKLYIK